MIKYVKKEEVIKNIEVADKCLCDVCKKEIPDGTLMYRVFKGHHDWGNDSPDSYRHLEICCDECLRKEFDKFMKEKSSSKFFEIELHCLDLKYE